MDKEHNVCDYSDTDYKKKFWEGSIDRSYEDLTEKSFVKRVIKYSNGGTIVDIGAGFGRLVECYKDKFQNVIVLDYASNLLDQAKKDHGENSHIKYIQASCYEMPIDDKSIDIAISFRLMHHIEDVSGFMQEAFRTIKPGGLFVLEYANKRNILEAIRFFTGNSDRKPFNRDPYKYNNSLFYNFHPKYMDKIVRESGFIVKKRFSLSNFRTGIFKKVLGVKLLCWLDFVFGRLLGMISFGPSIVLLMKRSDDCDT